MLSITQGTEVKIVDFYTLPNGLLGITCEEKGKFASDPTRSDQGLHYGCVEVLAEEPYESLPKGWMISWGCCRG